MYLNKEQLNKAAEDSFADKFMNLAKAQRPIKVNAQQAKEIEAVPVADNGEGLNIAYETLVFASTLNEGDVDNFIKSGVDSFAKRQALLRQNNQEMNAVARRRNMALLVQKANEDPQSLVNHEVAILNNLNSNIREILSSNYNRVGTNFIDKAYALFSGQIKDSDLEGDIPVFAKSMRNLIENRLTQQEQDFLKSVFLEAAEDVVHSPNGWMLDRTPTEGEKRFPFFKGPFNLSRDNGYLGYQAPESQYQRNLDPGKGFDPARHASMQNQRLRNIQHSMLPFDQNNPELHAQQAELEGQGYGNWPSRQLTIEDQLNPQMQAQLNQRGHGPVPEEPYKSSFHDQLQPWEERKNPPIGEGYYENLPRTQSRPRITNDQLMKMAEWNKPQGYGDGDFDRQLNQEVLRAFGSGNSSGHGGGDDYDPDNPEAGWMVNEGDEPQGMTEFDGLDEQSMPMSDLDPQLSDADILSSLDPRTRQVALAMVNSGSVRSVSEALKFLGAPDPTEYGFGHGDDPNSPPAPKPKKEYSPLTKKGERFFRDHVAPPGQKTRAEERGKSYTWTSGKKPGYGDGTPQQMVQNSTNIGSGATMTGFGKAITKWTSKN